MGAESYARVRQRLRRLQHAQIRRCEDQVGLFPIEPWQFRHRGGRWLCVSLNPPALVLPLLQSGGDEAEAPLATALEQATAKETKGAARREAALLSPSDNPVLSQTRREIEERQRLDAEASVPTCENSAAPCLIHTWAAPTPAAAVEAVPGAEFAVRGAAGNKLKSVAEGEADVAVLHRKTSSWDTCAP